MNERDAYQQKLQARIERAQAYALGLRASAREMSADAQIALLKRVDALNDVVEQSKAHLSRLRQAGEDKWMEAKAMADAAWSKLTEPDLAAAEQEDKGNADEQARGGR